MFIFDLEIDLFARSMLSFIMLQTETYKDTLHYYRKTRRLTHQEMAEFIGCHRLRYSRIEHGLHLPNDSEWTNFITGSRFPTDQEPLAFPDFSQAQFLLPSSMRGQAFVSSRVGEIFKNYCVNELGHQQWQELVKNLKIPTVYFNNRLNPYPYPLWLRTIELCKRANLFNDQTSIDLFAKSVINSKQGWGSKWNAFQSIRPDERFDVCLEDWSRRSLNHDIKIQKLSSKSSSLLIQVTANKTIPGNLYFDHPVVNNFFAQWICAILKALIIGPYYLTFIKERPSWFITVIRE